MPVDHSRSATERRTVSVKELAHPDAPKLLLPPNTTRAGLAIRNSLMAYMDNSQGAMDARIRLSAHGTKVLMTLAAQGLGTVVVPSDIAYAFSEYGTFYGPKLDGYEWVEVVKDGGDPIEHDVNATTRFWESLHDDHVRDVLEALRAAVHETFSDHPFFTCVAV
jgi:hypothetical protein